VEFLFMRFPLALSLLLVSLPAALAQTHFCVAGDLDHLNATQVADCQTKMSNVREAVKRRGAPSGWHFVVVCDESGWTNYASFVASGAHMPDEATFHTDQNLHWTFVRGSRMEADSAAGADTLLAGALKGISPKAIPTPNSRRILREPALSIASVEPPKLP
jgi:hypothetical protein